MSLWEQAFTFRGRIRRSDWWIKGILTAVAAGVFYVPFVLILGSPNGPLQGENGFYIYVGLELLILAPFVWVQSALNVKRAHDLNIPAWPVFAFQIFAIGSGYFPFDLLLPEDGPVTARQAFMATTIAYWVGNVIGNAILGFVPGTRGPNRFGPSTKAADKPAFIAPGGVD